MTASPEIMGVCPPEYAAVKDAFAANFVDASEGLNEQGARFSVCVGGETVIDLWGGRADAAGTVPFDERTLTPVFSTGKAVMALLIATCVERGLLKTCSTAQACVWRPPTSTGFGKALMPNLQIRSCR